MRDVYRKNYKEGGLSIGQFLFLLAKAVDKEYAQFQFQAALQGVDLDKAATKTAKNKALKSAGINKATGNEIFPHPDSYKNLSDDQKKAMTNRINGSLKTNRLDSLTTR